jgi:hypothetical protein
MEEIMRETMQKPVLRPPVKHDVEKPQKWAYNRMIVEYMMKNHGGDLTAYDISEVLWPMFEKLSRNKTHLAAEFRENLGSIIFFLSVRYLTPELRPLVDKLRADRDRINAQLLDILVRIPEDRQVEILQKAKALGNGTIKSTMVEVERLGEEYIREFNATHKSVLDR